MDPIKKIKVKGIVYEVVDDTARVSLENKLDKPVIDGKENQVLTKTATGIEWLDTKATDVPSKLSALENDMGFVDKTYVDEAIANIENSGSTGGSVEYTAGYGLTLNGTEFSVDPAVMATVTLVENSVQDLLNEIPNTDNFVTTTQLNNAIGDINSILDSINGEEI